MDPNERMNSENFVKVLRMPETPAVMRKNKPTLLQDKATPHISKVTSSYLRSEGVKPKLIPRNTPDFMPVENQIMENWPTKTFAELKVEARRAWRSLPASYLRSLIESMPNRMKLAIEKKGNMTGY